MGPKCNETCTGGPHRIPAREESRFRPRSACEKSQRPVAFEAHLAAIAALRIPCRRQQHPRGQLMLRIRVTAPGAVRALECPKAVQSKVNGVLQFESNGNIRKRRGSVDRDTAGEC